MIFFVGLSFTFFSLTLYSILQENLPLLDFEKPRFLLVRVLSTEASASLFVTVLGALLVRNQFVLGLRPRISYKSDNIGSGTAWQVKIKNAGLGAAIINRCVFELETFNSTECSLPIEFEDVINNFSKIGLVYETDFSLGKISSGFTFPPQEEYTVFDIKTEHIHKVSCLNMILYFQGFLGDKYYRRIVLIPENLTREKMDTSFFVKK